LRASPAVRRITVPADHPAFAGHFPGSPVLPGAALLDEMIALCEREHALDPVYWQIESAKFLAAVGPGAELTLEVAPSIDRCELIARAGGRVAMRALLRRRTAS